MEKNDDFICWIFNCFHLLCALVTGFIFTYAVVVMPGFAKLDDQDFIRAFQVTDGVTQNNQPLFMTCLGGLDRIRCCHHDPGVYRTPWN